MTDPSEIRPLPGGSKRHHAWRRRYRKGTLPAPINEMLEREHGSYWTEFRNKTVWDSNWEQRADAVRRFYVLTGSMPSQHSPDLSERVLGVWVRRQKACEKRGELSPERIAALDAISPKWRPPDKGSGWEVWVEFASRAEDFAKKAGNRPSARSKDPQEKQLGVWLRSQVHLLRTGALQPDRLDWLDDHISGWRPVGFDERWVASSLQLSMFLKVEGRFPGRNGDKAEGMLRQWLAHQIRRLREGKLETERAEWLDRNVAGWRQDGLESSTLDPRWLRKAIALEKFVEKTGTLPWQHGEDMSERSLGLWLKRQQAMQRSGCLQADREAWLNEHLPVWMLTPDQVRWIEQARSLVDFVVKRGAAPSQNGTDPNERSMASWLQSQRKAVRSGRAAQARIDWLDSNLQDWRSIKALDRNEFTQRVRAGVQAAKARGVKFGKQPPKPETVESKVKIARQLMAEDMTAREAAEMVGWSRTTLYRYLREFGAEQTPVKEVEVRGRGRSAYAARKTLPARTARGTGG